MMRTYTEAAAFLAAGRNLWYRATGERGTAVERLNDHTIALRYHGTNVVTWHSDGAITLNTGGWYTVTTKKRMNDYSPFIVYQHKFDWYVIPDGKRWEADVDKVVPFQNGMRILPDNSIAA